MMDEVIHLDDQGRITIPPSIREKYGIKPGDQLKITDDLGQFIIRPIKTEAKKLRANRKWGKEAFMKAGKATFGD